MHPLLLVALGGAIGLSLGVIGGGGSILTVPILVYLVGQDAHTATASSLAIVGAISVAGTVPHWRAHRVSLGTALPFSIVGIAGTVVGALANHLLPGWLILGLFGALMVAVAVRMLTSARRVCAVPPPAARGRSRWLRVGLAGLAVGALTGFFGVGGGFLIVPALVLVLGLGMREAVGTSLLIIALNSGSALLAHLRYGIPFGAVLTIGLLVLGGAGGALLGALASGRVDEARLQRGFAGFVALLGVWLLASNLLPVLFGR